MSKVKFFTALAIIFSTANALANPLYDRLTANYNPQIQVTEKFETGLLCDKKEVVIKATDPITQNSYTIDVVEYLPKTAQKGSVLLLPPTGGTNILDKSYGTHFCLKNSLRVVILKSHQGESIGLDPRDHDREILRTAHAMRHTLEYIGEDQVAVFGTSVGALSATMLMGIDERAVGGVLIVGGVGMADIIARSTEQGLTQLRKARMNHLQMNSLNDYVEYMREHQTIDPGLLSENYANNPTLFVLATEDTTVPTENQQQLLSQLNKAEIIEYQDDHMGAILSASWRNKSRFGNFLMRVLQIP